MRAVWMVVLAACLMAVGCRRVDEPLPRPDLSSRKAKVVATTGMIADIVREVGGDHVEVECLLGPGGDPHKYYPTFGDLKKLEEADLIVYNGLDLEAKMGDVFEKMAKVRRTVAVGAAIPKEQLRVPDEGFEGSHDPHIWFDVKLWMLAVGAVRDALVELDPAHAAEFEQRTLRYLHRLKELDDEVRALAARVPTEKRVIITAHDAFGYFGRAYGFQVEGLQGTSTATQAGTRSITRLATIIGDRKIPVIFGETSVPDEGIKSVEQAVRDRYKDFRVTLCEARLYSDALGEPGSPGGTYEGMVRHNITTIVEAISK